MAIIILEGCDCTGKTTLANELAKRTGYEIVKGSSFEISQLGADGMFEYMMGLLDRDNIIIDRFYHSNYVYGFLYDYPLLKASQFFELADKTDKRAVVVYLHANERVIANRMVERGDKDINVQDVKNIIKRYNEIICHPILANKMTIQINTTYSHDVKLTAAMLTEFINLQETNMFIYNPQ